MNQNETSKKRKAKGVRRLAGSSLPGTPVNEQPTAKKYNAVALEKNLKRMVETDQREIRDERDKLLRARSEGEICELAGWKIEIDNTIRNWPEMTDTLSEAEWNRFYEGFFTRSSLKHGYRGGADAHCYLDAVEKVRARILYCGNNESLFPDLRSRLRFRNGRDGVVYQAITPEKREEIRELQRFALSMDAFNDLTTKERGIMEAFIDTWSEELTAIGLDTKQAEVEKAIEHVQTLAINLQRAFKKQGQPMSEALKSLGASVHDDGGISALEADWSYENKLSLKGTAKDPYRTQKHFQQDEEGPEPAFGGARITREP